MSEQPLPRPETGKPIIGELGIHNCAPFCPTCNHRLLAFATSKFYDAPIDGDGWHIDGAEESCIELEAQCVNEQCSTKYQPIEIDWCYAAGDDCDKTQLRPKEDSNG